MANNAFEKLSKLPQFITTDDVNTILNVISGFYISYEDEGPKRKKGFFFYSEETSPAMPVEEITLSGPDINETINGEQLVKFVAVMEMQARLLKGAV